MNIFQLLYLYRMIAVLLLCWVNTFFLHAQSKPPIDSSVYNNWPSLGYYMMISNNGKYVIHTILNQPLQGSTLVILATDQKWKKEFVNLKEARFTEDSKVAVFQTGDSLCLLHLGTESKKVIPKIVSYNLSESGADSWLAYRLKSKEDNLVLRNLSSGQEKEYAQVKEFQFSKGGDLLLLQVGADEKTDLQLVDLQTGKIKSIWRGTGLSNVVFDQTNTQLAFCSESVDSNSKKDKAYWYYKIRDPAARLLVSDLQQGPDSKLKLGDISGFSSDGRRLLIYLNENELLTHDPDAVPLNIWSYKDVKVQSAQLLDIKPSLDYACNKNLLGFIDLKDGKITLLQKEEENVYTDLRVSRNRYYLTGRENINGYGESWYPESKWECMLAATNTSARITLPAMGSISPEGRFFIYYDFKEKNYFSYETSTGITRNITKAVQDVSWVTTYNTREKEGQTPPLPGWLLKDEAVLLHDEYGVWQVDPLAKKKPMLLTGGEVNKGDLYLEEINTGKDVFRLGEKIILSGFNRKTKENGFYEITAGVEHSLKLLSSGKYFYYAQDGAVDIIPGSNFVPVRAKNSDAYVVRRMSETEAPNYFFTRDFKTFTPLSDLHPEKKYNWYSTELHQWESQYYPELQGVLYKPENFDPKKKYPVIIYYYEILSNALHAYIKPEPSDGRLNIPWYVSNEYLVFTPDIHYEIGDPFEKGTYDCVVSATHYLKTLPFVDGSRMGIQGISWGGVQTNYLVTHTDLFAAACSASSVSDLVSAYNGLGQGDASAQAKYEQGQYRVGFPLWDNPDWYIKNSPIMSADKVTTPLLLMQTPKDKATRFDQAIELFNALRRLRKKVWLLEYSEGDHGVWGRSGMDFDLRMQQFFNHYLKGTPPPQWMTIGREARFKNSDPRLELDTSGVQP